MFPPGVFDGNLDLSDVDMQGYVTENQSYF